MPQPETPHSFTYTHRADCKTCGKYVGPSRKDWDKAEADKTDHLNKPGKADHDVEIETTQHQS